MRERPGQKRSEEGGRHACPSEGRREGGLHCSYFILNRANTVSSLSAWESERLFFQWSEGETGENARNFLPKVLKDTRSTGNEWKQRGSRQIKNSRARQATHVRPEAESPIRHVESRINILKALSRAVSRSSSFLILFIKAKASQQSRYNEQQRKAA